MCRNIKGKKVTETIVRIVVIGLPVKTLIRECSENVRKVPDERNAFVHGTSGKTQ